MTVSLCKTTLILTDLLKKINTLFLGHGADKKHASTSQYVTGDRMKGADANPSTSASKTPKPLDCKTRVFLVLNSDILCEGPPTKFPKAHPPPHIELVTY